MKARFGRGKARRDAAFDMARLYSDDLSREDERVIAERQAADEAYQKEFLGTAKLLSDMKGLADSSGIQSILGGQVVSSKRQKAAAALRESWSGMAMAAGLLLAVAVGLMTYLDSEGRFNSVADVDRYVTRVGEQKQIELKDGSLVNLNTNSELLVSLTANARELTLRRGEAFFDVVKDPNRPFSVDLGSRTVTALGTAFNIRKELESFNLAVIEGVVALHKTNERVDTSANMLSVEEGEVIDLHASLQYRVGAGWVAEFDGGRKELSGYASSHINDIQNWRTGLLSFEGESLYKVVQELNRYSAKKILIENKSIMDMKIYAVIKVGRIHSAINGLEKTHAVKVSRFLDRIVIVGASE